MAEAATEAATGADIGGGLGGFIGGLGARLFARDIEQIPQEVIDLWQDIMNRPAVYDTREFTPQDRAMLGQMGLYLGESPAEGLIAEGKLGTEYSNPAYERSLRGAVQGVRDIANQGMTAQERAIAQQGQNMMQQQAAANLAGTQRNLQARGLRSAAAGVAAGQQGAQNMANMGAGYGQAVAANAANARRQATMALPGIENQATESDHQRRLRARGMLNSVTQWAAGLNQQQQQQAAKLGQTRDQFNIGLRQQLQEGNLARARGEKIRGQGVRNRASESQWNQRFAGARQWTNAQNEMNRILQAQNAADAELFTAGGEAIGTAAGAGATA